MIKISANSSCKNVFLIKKREPMPIVLAKKHLNGSEIIEKLKEKQMINIEITNGNDAGSYTFTENTSRLLTKMGAGNVKSAFALKGVINMVMSHLIAKGQITDLDNLSDLRSHLEDGAQFTLNKI